MLLGEEERFLHTLHQGMRELDSLIAQHREDGTRRITGTEAFQLYDTFGFPIDLAEEVALEAGLNLDRQDFEDGTRGQACQSARDLEGLGGSAGGAGVSTRLATCRRVDLYRL